MKGSPHVGEKDCCLRKAADVCLEDGTAAHAKLADGFTFRRWCCRGAFIVRTMMCLVRAVPGSEGGIVMEPEAGETEGSP